MSTKTFVPIFAFQATEQASPFQRVVDELVVFFQAIALGIAASRDYERMTASGMPSADAARRVFDTHFDRPA